MPITIQSIPVLEQITRKVAARLNTINASNGYIFNVVEVVRPKRRNDYSPKNGVAVVQVESFQQTEPEIDSQGLKTSRTANYTIDVFVEPSDDDERPYDALCATAIAEIERAFTVDFYPTSGIGPFEGTASNAFTNAPQIFRDQAGRSAGVRINLSVRFRYADTDPYTPL